MSKFEYFIWQAIPTSRGQALANEYGVKFFETVSEQVPLMDICVCVCVCMTLKLLHLFCIECKNQS